MLFNKPYLPVFVEGVVVLPRSLSNQVLYFHWRVKETLSELFFGHDDSGTQLQGVHLSLNYKFQI